MCIDFSGKLLRDYSISFFSGLAASLVITFSLAQQQRILNLLLAFWLFTLYFIGLVICGHFNWRIKYFK